MARRRTKERRRSSARRRTEMHTTGGDCKYLSLPDGWSFMSVKPGKYRLDFMSYVVSKGKDEDGGNPYFEKGELAFERTFFIHRDVGPNKDWHLCAAKTLNKPCPVCEFRAKLARDPNADEDLIKELSPKERQIFIVKDLSEPDENYILEMSHHLLGKQLDSKIRSGDEEDGYDYFADPVDGYTVRINFEQSDRGKWVEATDIEFRSRKSPYDEDVCDEMPDLDLMIRETDYDRLKKLFLESGDDDSDDADDDESEVEEKSKRGRDKKKTVSTVDEFGLEEGDRVEYEGQECEIVRISKDGTSLTLEDEDGEMIKAVGVDEVEKVESEEEEEKEEPPKKQRGKSTGSRSKKSRSESESEDDDDEEEEEEEEEELPKKKRKSSKKAKADDDDDDDDWDDWD